MRSDRWYKLGRELLYGRLEDEKPFNTVRRLVQQEDYALSLIQRAGHQPHLRLRRAHPRTGVPAGHRVLRRRHRVGDAEVDEQVIDDGLGIIRKLWDAGLAHRDIKPANLLVRDGLLLIDVAFVQARPSPWRQAVDLANMMLLPGPALQPRTGLPAGPCASSRSRRSPRGSRPPAGWPCPRSCRMLRAQGRDLHAEFVRMLPTPPQPVSIQRWSWRRVGLMGATAVLLVLTVAALISITNNDAAAKTSIEVSSLPCTDLEPLWLQAQAVPSASLVPCVRDLPVGWSLENVAVNDGRSVISLIHDRTGGQAMEARLTAGCDVAGVAEQASAPPVRRYQLVTRQGPVFQAVRFDVFPAAASSPDRALLEPGRGHGAAPDILGFVTRDPLSQALDQRSGGRLHL